MVDPWYHITSLEASLEASLDIAHLQSMVDPWYHITSLEASLEAFLDVALKTSVPGWDSTNHEGTMSLGLTTELPVQLAEY